MYRLLASLYAPQRLDKNYKYYCWPTEKSERAGRFKVGVSKRLWQTISTNAWSRGPYIDRPHLVGEVRDHGEIEPTATVRGLGLPT